MVANQEETMKTAVWLSLFILPLATAQQPVPLSYGVPDDMHFFVHGMTSQTPDPAFARLERAVRMLADSGIYEDVIDLATMDMSEREREEVSGVIEHVCGLISRVDWPLLVEREMVFAYRMSMPIPEYIAIFRVPEDRVGEQIAGLKAMLDGFAEMAGLPPESVREVKRQTGTLTVFSVKGVPVLLAAGTVGDALVLSTSTRLATASMRLLARGDGARSLGANARFEQGLSQLPAPTEDVFFVDLHGMVDFWRLVTRMAMMEAGGHGEQGQWRREILGLATVLIDEIDVIDHVVATTNSDGQTTQSTSLIQLVPDFESTEMMAVVGRQRPWTDWHRRVPADATGFGFDTGMNFAALYDLIVARMRESDVMEAMLREHQLPLDEFRDGLGHISGEMAWVSLPPTGLDGCAMGEMVCSLRLVKPDAIAGMLPQWVDDASRFLASRGQSMVVTSRDGIYEIELAAFPWLHPTIGVRNDELVFATSPAALARIERVQQDLEPGIRERAEFRALGIGDHDTVESLAYGRVSAGAGGLPDLISAVGFGMSMLPEDGDTRPIIKLGMILSKLTRALRELDVGYDWGMEAMAGKTADTWITRSVFRFHQHL